MQMTVSCELTACSNSVVLRGGTLPPGDIWQCLETFLVDTAEGQDAAGIKGTEDRDAIEHPTVCRWPPAKIHPAQTP